MDSHRPWAPRRATGKTLITIVAVWGSATSASPRATKASRRETVVLVEHRVEHKVTMEQYGCCLLERLPANL